MSNVSIPVHVKVDREELKLCVKKPNLGQLNKAKEFFNEAFNSAILSKAFVRAKLNDVLKEQQLWDDNKTKKYEELQAEILDGERQLKTGGIKLSEAKRIAINLRKLRNEFVELISVRTNLDSYSAEGQAENAKFNYLVSVCLVYENDGKPYYASLEDYLAHAGDEAAMLGAQALSSLMYGLASDYESKLTENKFLKKHGFVDDKLRLIDRQGRLIDEDGRLIDEDGRFINENGEYVDRDGRLVTKEGEFLVEVKPFLDDDGKPIEEASNTGTVEEPAEVT